MNAKSLTTLDNIQLDIVCGGSYVGTKTSENKGSRGDLEQNPTTGNQQPPQSVL